MSIASGMTSSNEPSRFTSTGAELVPNHALKVRIDRTGNPHTGLIIDAAGRGVDQWVLSFGMWPI